MRAGHGFRGACGHAQVRLGAGEHAGGEGGARAHRSGGRVLLQVRVMGGGRERRRHAHCRCSVGRRVRLGVRDRSHGRHSFCVHSGVLQIVLNAVLESALHTILHTILDR